MKSKMKRLLAMLLTLAMVTGLMPGAGLAVYADDTIDLSAYINQQVTFNGEAWYLVAADSSTATLFYKASMGDRRAFGADSSYAASSAKAYLDSLTEQGSSYEAVSDVIMSVDLNDVGVTGAKIYLPSVDEVKDFPASILQLAGDVDGTFQKAYGWWLRTPTSGDTVRCVEMTNATSKAGAPSDRKYIRPMLRLDLSKVRFKNGTFKLIGNTYSVSLTGGANATASPAENISQDVDEGDAMETVTYTAEDGYCFADFDAITVNGVTAEKTSRKEVTVSGTPTDDVTLTVPDAIIDTTEGDPVEPGGDPVEPGGSDATTDAALAAAAAKAQGKGSIKADEFSVKAATSGKKTVYTLDCEAVSGNNAGTLTILKGEKVMLPGFDKKTSGLEIDKKTLSVSGKGLLSAKKGTTDAGSTIKYTTVSGNKVNVNVVVVDPSIENRTISDNSVSSNGLNVDIKKLSVKMTGAGAFDLHIKAPLTINADTAKAKVKGDIKFADSRYISIDENGDLHITGTVTGKGTAKIPFTAFGKKYTIKISAKPAKAPKAPKAAKSSTSSSAKK